MAAANEVTGIAGQSRASYANMLKLWYAQRWDDHVHNASLIMRMIGQKGENMGGERVRGVVVTGFPQSAGITTREGRPLPTAQPTTQINPELFARDFYTLLQWTGQAERSAAAGQKAAWAKPRKIDMELARKQADINMCRKLYLAYADINSVVASFSTPTVTIQGRNARTSSGSAYWYHGSFYHRVNQSVGFVDAAVTYGAMGAAAYDIEGAASPPANEVTITAIGGTQAAPTFAVSTIPSGAALTTVFTPAVGDWVVPFGNRASSGFAGNADDITLFSGFNGIGNICTDTSIYGYLYGLSKTTYTNLQGQYQANSGTVRPFEERLVTVLVDSIRDNGTGNEPDSAICHSSVRREVVAEHDGDRRYAPVQTDSGFGRLVIHVGDTEMPVYSDWMCQPAMMVLLNTDAWSWVEQSPMGPIDDSLERWVAGFDQHQIIWHKSGNIECQRPFDQGILDDISINVYGLNIQ